MKKITPDSLSVEEYRFEEKKQSLIIDSKYRPNNPKTVKELWPHKQLWYDFGTGQFKYLQFDALINQAREVLKK